MVRRKQAGASGDNPMPVMGLKPTKRRTASSEPLSFGRDFLSVPAPPLMEKRGRRRKDRGEQPDDRFCLFKDRAKSLRGAGGV